MEKRINNKINTSQANFKNTIKNWLDENECKLIINDENKTNDFLEFMFNLNINTLETSDFEKRKRIKNHVPQFDQCNAKKANNTRCTRRKQHNSDFCGTHIKGTPHGIIEPNNTTIHKKKIEVWVQDIKGINSYIDADNNVYKPEDIISNKENPDIIAKWEINQQGEYCIPCFNI